VINLIIGIVLGMLLGVLAIFGLVGSNQGVADNMLGFILRKNKDGWALVQRGNKYTLDMLTRADDADAWIIGDEETGEWLEDPADKMHMLHGVPFGLKLATKRPIADVETASATSFAAGMETDGGKVIGPDEVFTMEEITSKMTVGTMQLEGGVVRYLNPYVDAARDGIVDLRDITKAFRYDSGSDTPRKAAKNATEAERAFEQFGDIKEFGKIMAAFIGGAVAAFIGGSGGGGGGGGGVSIPVMLDVATSLGVF
jgi:hypothetical protein